ncbi:serine/arginine-rich splicing factor SC35-like [Camellia sinensis]|uniref:serine/arginine-rich splicing factor SC35-like n=1 Tax=Camellia sinensis TaxID=4442 RepID=UPI001035960C|nr:serine/arginine-rich splicing factor SC35-like [Camellia sinensis]
MVATTRAREVGGWRLVLYERGRRKQGSVPAKPGIYTIFVDNIPLSMNPKGLYELFKKFGVVRDMFIPTKTRKTTRSRFGFVRYDFSVAAEMAIQKANGVWCDDKALRVKFTEFAKDTSAGRGWVSLLKKRRAIGERNSLGGVIW